MVLRQLIIHEIKKKYKKAVGSLLTPYTENNSRWAKNPNVQDKILNLIQDDRLSYDLTC